MGHLHRRNRLDLNIHIVGQLCCLDTRPCRLGSRYELQNGYKGSDDEGGVH
jgi:hypothetical protein